MLQSLYNTEISEARAIGYCRRHHCHLSCTQLKRKECLKKQCTHLQKCEHEFWHQRELVKAKRQQRKITMKEISNSYGRESV
jgi:hypothetical protein